MGASQLGSSLLAQSVQATPGARLAPVPERLDRFLTEPRIGAALRCWLGLAADATLERARLVERLSCDIARLDALIGEQVNAILHHPRFQQLEASWRGLAYLASQASGTEGVQVRVLDLGWQELARDLERAIEFDQSQIFNKIYSEEFGSPGGEPFGVILGDYEVRHRTSAEHPSDDLEVLRGMSQIAAAAFAPFVVGASPAILGVNRFSELSPALNLPSVFEQLEYLKWRAFRDEEDARFVGLTLPKVLMRLPHADDGTRTDRFRFQEQVAGPDNARYLWGNAVYAFGSVLVRAFASSGWLADIEGVTRDELSGGLVTGLPSHCFGTDEEGIAPKYCTDVMLTDEWEAELAELGFIALCHCKDSPWAAFYASASVQKPKRYDRAPATVNARLSCSLRYILCASRFAHYMKVIGRDKVGSFASAEELQSYLHRWLLDYTIATDDASAEAKARAPLREGQVRVREVPGRPGSYTCVLHLRPHFQLEQLITGVRLVTELATAS